MIVIILQYTIGSMDKKNVPSIAITQLMKFMFLTRPKPITQAIEKSICIRFSPIYVALNLDKTSFQCSIGKGRTYSMSLEKYNSFKMTVVPKINVKIAIT